VEGVCEVGLVLRLVLSYQSQAGKGWPLQLQQERVRSERTVMNWPKTSSYLPWYDFCYGVQGFILAVKYERAELNLNHRTGLRAGVCDVGILKSEISPDTYILAVESDFQHIASSSFLRL